MSRSASSRITSGFLPPISSWKRPNRAAIPVATPTPTAWEPVNVTPRTRGSCTSRSPTTRPGPITRLNTPSGTPEREMISARDQALAGTSSAGLHTTVHP